MERLTGIYAIHNLITGKKYVGQSVDMFTRNRTHFHSLRANKHHSLPLQNSFNLHGRDVFVFGVIEECVKEDLNDREDCWINYFNSYHKGYNATKQSKYNARGKVPTLTKFNIYNKDLKLLESVEGYNKLGEYFNTPTVTITKTVSKIESMDKKNWYYKDLIIIKHPMTLERHLNRMKIYQMNLAITASKEGNKCIYITYPKYRKLTTKELSIVRKKEGKRRVAKSGKFKVKVYWRDTNEFIGEYISSRYACEELRLSIKQLNKVYTKGRNYYKGYIFERPYISQ